jgi:hypothetical protein
MECGILINVELINKMEFVEQITDTWNNMKESHSLNFDKNIPDSKSMLDLNLIEIHRYNSI